MEDSNKKKVLVVDDDENLTTVLVDKLNLSGFDALGALDGEEGLKKALTFHPDIILLDLVMPKMSGLDMLKKLRADPWGKGVGVVVLTALEQQIDYMAKAVESGIWGYLVKTNYSLDEVIQKVKDMLSQSNTAK
ncbi:hypothetical protein A2814_02800 [Candidatus Nomurabacteria bacterium RIFCSPHIGHO2_01_FULL_38_19]|uniref:Response regulatory domain-containing protein n=1 Tax=Candidatus Nomurabacteria bacterium RIFCSPHIGHO2_01_FULL_38_19 TaxID=1801732 RepID=A0A1F6US86_9BACT|nr:MAG: hypothetical protein A2814_02800 [Candidatus Nomurabacteria bacterium RIFCSPHIGHO2_01_FULL_38_19]